MTTKLTATIAENALLKGISPQRLVLIWGLALTTAVLTSCGGTIGPPPPRQLISVTVQPNSTSANQGNSVRFSATGTFNQTPATQDNLPAQWASSDTNVATIDGSGVATCVSIGGPATISASAPGRGGLVQGTATLTCQISPNSVAVLSPTTLHLLCQLIGQPVGCSCGTGRARLTNTGGATLNISSITRPSAPFAEFNDCPSSLLAGQACTINVSFNPTTNSAGLGFFDSVSIQDDAPDTPQFLGLRGTADCHN